MKLGKKRKRSRFAVYGVFSDITGMIQSIRPQHRLYFLPLLQGQGALGRVSGRLLACADIGMSLSRVGALFLGMSSTSGACM